MGNQALTINSPGSSTFALTTNGSNWLWSVFSLMSLSAIIIGLLSLRVQSKERSLYLFNISILITASIAYFCMASDLGFTPIEVFQHGPGTRQIWYVRYIDWVITTPLLIIELFLIADLSMSVTLSSIFADIVTIICGLIGGLVPTIYKWAFFVFGCVTMFWVFSNILLGIKTSRGVSGIKNQRIYLILAVWILFFWSIYPIAWGLCEGSNVISVTGEMIFYGILDIFTKPIFAFLTLFLHRNVDINEQDHEAKIHFEPPKYSQEQQQPEIEDYSVSYVMPSPNMIRIHY